MTSKRYYYSSHKNFLKTLNHKNNTWKQVFASPQSPGNIYLSKFVTVQLMILFCFLLFNVLTVLTGVAANFIHPEFPFLHTPIDLEMLFYFNFKVYISILGISAIQYFLSLRFKNFIAPIGIGLFLIIGSVLALNLQWEHVYKLPYTYPIFSSNLMTKAGRPFLENHEWNSIGYFVFFLLLGFLDMKTRKEKG